MANQYLGFRVAPADVAFGLMAEYEADPHPRKVSLIAGTYRDENGRPWILPSVKEVRKIGKILYHFLPKALSLKLDYRQSKISW